MRFNPQFLFLLRNIAAIFFFIIYNALAFKFSCRWFGAAKFPCGSLKTHSAGTAFGRQEPVSERMAG